MYVVINGYVCIECNADTPKAFKYCGTWYVRERNHDTMKRNGGGTA